MKRLVLLMAVVAAMNCFGQTMDEKVAQFDVSQIKKTQEIFFRGLKDSLIDRDAVDSLIELKQNTKAIRLLTEELIVNPGNTYAIHLIGYIHNSSGSPDKAVPYFVKAIEMIPFEPTFHYNLGLAYNRLNKNQLAVQEYTEAIRLDPKNKLSYYNRAVAYEALRDFKCAIEDYNVELSINGEESRIFNNRGRCYMILEEYDQALKDFNKALELDPFRALAYRNRGTLYLRMKKQKEACADLQKAFELGDTDTRLRDQYCE